MLIVVLKRPPDWWENWHDRFIEEVQGFKGRVLDGIDDPNDILEHLPQVEPPTDLLAAVSHPILDLAKVAVHVGNTLLNYKPNGMRGAVPPLTGRPFVAVAGLALDVVARHWNGCRR